MSVSRDGAPPQHHKVLVPIADGCEDVETACITDVLVRAGIEVVTASVMPEGDHVTMARGMKVTANSGNISKVIASADPASSFDAIAIPGGMPGAKHIGEHTALMHFAKEMQKNGKIVAAICAAPVIALGPHKLLDGVKAATCFPMMKDKMCEGTHWTEQPVVVDRVGGTDTKVITSQGPGTALHFALQIAAHVKDAETAANVAKGMLVHDFHVHQPISKQ